RRPEPGGHQVLRRGDEVPERRQGGGGAVGAGEPVRRDGRFPRRAPGVLQADPRVPELRGGGARAAEAERAGELAASRERRLAGGVLTLGNFDGAHLGHQAIVRRAVARAREAAGLAVALTFEPHPVAVLAPARAPLMLQTLHDRLASLAGLGIDVTVVQRFTRAFAALDPEAFVRDFLLRHVELVYVVVG